MNRKFVIFCTFLSLVPANRLWRPSWHILQVKPPPTAPTPLETCYFTDREFECGRRAARGQCLTEKSYMQIQCQRTCSCPGGPLHESTRSVFLTPPPGRPGDRYKKVPLPLTVTTSHLTKRKIYPPASPPGVAAPPGALVLRYPEIPRPPSPNNENLWKLESPKPPGRKGTRKYLKPKPKPGKVVEKEEEVEKRIVVFPK